MQGKIGKKSLTLLMGMMFIVPSLADASPAPKAIDQNTRVASYCTKHFSRLERKYGLPKHVMMAVSSTESGRWNKQAGMLMPWPWTINAEGKGQYFQTKHEAVTAVQRLREKGVTSIDVGCMQINLHHHPKAFTSISQAFDPAYNTAYAAKFLRQNYESERSWSKAVAAYHSKTPSRGRDYFAKVKKNWRNVMAASRGRGLDDLPYIAKGGQSVTLASLDAPSITMPKRAKAKPKRRSKSMKIIKVMDKPNQTPRKAPEVLVVRPQASTNKTIKPVVVASNNATANPLQKSNFVLGKKDAPTISAQQNSTEPTQERVSSRKKGPNFIFH